MICPIHSHYYNGYCSCNQGYVKVVDRSACELDVPKVLNDTDQARNDTDVGHNDEDGQNGHDYHLICLSVVVVLLLVIGVLFYGLKKRRRFIRLISNHADNEAFHAA
ncbi:hypothetical protein PENTCL1PPCAC_29869 [Pristionchus entomophagus]|uniref:EGF-like domain-containing protein n=1 Tax=Pristionchus entomophagus TaxID=358040 RepID=A0AAV5UNY7_9BILA|nr:hypothetical protein PENTCL1PPCAC_29869 [Pristionchus entomophagus]